MKPCSKNQKLIALLAMDALSNPQARELRSHLQTCPACRNYFEEIAAVAKRLAAVEISPDIQTSESFHRRIVRGLAAQASRSPWETLAEYFGTTRLSWRVAIPVVAGIALAFLVFWPFRQDSNAPPPVQPLAHAVPKLKPKPELPPTLSNYQTAANRSPEALDELLAKQAARNPSPAPIYTASTRSGLDAAD